MSACTRRWRKRCGRILITSLVFLLCMTPIVVAQSTPIIGPTDALAFDYPNTDFETYVVERFEVSYDSGAFSLLAAPKYQDTGGVSSYKFIPAPTSGTHTASIRACNAIGCGPGSSPFAFAVLVNSPASAPGNLRKVTR